MRIKSIAIAVVSSFVVMCVPPSTNTLVITASNYKYGDLNITVDGRAPERNMFVQEAIRVPAGRRMIEIRTYDADMVCLINLDAESTIGDPVDINIVFEKPESGAKICDLEKEKAVRATFVGCRPLNYHCSTTGIDGMTRREGDT